MCGELFGALLLFALFLYLCIILLCGEAKKNAEANQVRQGNANTSSSKIIGEANEMTLQIV
jgi:hypothetical protein